MSFDIPLHISTGSPEAQIIESVMFLDKVTAQEAVLKILRDSAGKINPALSGLGLFGSPEDVRVIDEVVAQAYEERHRPSNRKTSF